MSDTQVAFWVRGFDRRSEELEVEHQLPLQWTLNALQTLMAVPADDLMYGCFPLGLPQRQELGASMGQVLSGDLDFFLEAEQA